MFSQDAANNLYMFFVFTSALAFFWLLEVVWANDKRWLPLIILLPATIVFFIVKYWEEIRFRCFIAALLMVIILLVGGLVGRNFFVEICQLWFKLMLWPYFVGKALLINFS